MLSIFIKKCYSKTDEIYIRHNSIKKMKYSVTNIDIFFEYLLTIFFTELNLYGSTLDKLLRKDDIQSQPSLANKDFSE